MFTLKSILLPCALVLLFQLPCTAQIYFEKKYTFTDSVTSQNSERKIIKTLDHHLMVMSSRGDWFTPYFDILLTKIDTNGNQLWTSKIVVSQESHLFNITQFSDSSYYLSGFFAATPLGSLVIHVSKDGQFLGAKKITNDNVFAGYGYDIKALSDSSLGLISRTGPLNNLYELGYLIVDPDLNVLSNKYVKINNQTVVDANLYRQTSGSCIGVVHMKRPGFANDRMLGVIKYDVQGNVVWAKQLGNPGDIYYMQDIHEFTNGDIAICGHYETGSTYYGCIYRLNSSGDFLWGRLFNTAKCSFYGLVDDGPNNFIATGLYLDTLYKPKAIDVLFDNSGNMLGSTAYKYTDILLGPHYTINGFNNEYYSAFSFQQSLSSLSGVLIQKYDNNLRFCDLYNLNLSAVNMPLADSSGWSEASYQHTTTDASQYFSQSFITWPDVTRCMTTGLETPGDAGSFGIYPNPASSAVTIDWSGYEPGSAMLQITDLTGRVVYTDVPESQKLHLDVSTLPKSVYFVILRTQTSTVSGKFVVQ